MQHGQTLHTETSWTLASELRTCSRVERVASMCCCRWCGFRKSVIKSGKWYGRETMCFLPSPDNKKQIFVLLAMSRIPFQTDYSPQESVLPPKMGVELVVGHLVLRHRKWMPSSPGGGWYNFPGVPRSSRNGGIGLSMRSTHIAAPQLRQTGNRSAHWYTSWIPSHQCSEFCAQYPVRNF